MTPDILINRTGVSATSGHDNQPKLQVSDLNNRLHQYRNKLLAATNRSANAKPAEPTVKEDKSNVPAPARTVNKRVNHNSAYDSAKKSSNEKEISNDGVSNQSGFEDSSSSTEINQDIVAVVNVALDIQDQSTITTDVEDVGVETDKVVDTTAETPSVNILTSFHPLSQLQKAGDTSGNEQVATKTPLGLTKLFSRFDQGTNLNVAKPAIQPVNVSEETVQENVGTVPAEFARFLNNAGVVPKNKNETAPVEVDLQVQDVPVIDESVITTAEVPDTSEELKLIEQINNLLAVNKTEETSQSEESDETELDGDDDDVESAESFQEIKVVEQENIQPVVQETRVQAPIKFDETIPEETDVAVTLNEDLAERISATIEENAAKVENQIAQGPVNEDAVEAASSSENLAQADLSVDVDENSNELDPEFYGPVTGENKISHASHKTSEVNVGTQVKEIVEQVKQMFLHLTDGPQSMRVRLNPPELGMVQLDIVRTENGIVARIQTETVQAHQLIKDGIQQLKESLMIQGQNIQSIQVDLSPDLSKDRDSEQEPQRREQEQSQEEQREGSQNRKQQQDQQQSEKYRADYITEMDMEI